MNLQEIAYLLRYLFLILIVGAAAQLLRLAIREFRWGLQHALRPARGYFLLAMQGARRRSEIQDRERRAAAKQMNLPQGEGARRYREASEAALRFHDEIAEYEYERRQGETASPKLQTLALYPTTILGRGHCCDIQIRNKKILKRHATIYRYDGEWFLRPQSGRAEVSINGVAIDASAPLRKGDQIHLAGIRFDFIDERASAREAGISYTGAKVDDAYFRDALRLSSKAPTLSFLAYNLFSILAIAMMVYYLPVEFHPKQEMIGGMLAGALVLSDLYYLILPRLLYYFDRLLLLSLNFLSMVGLLMQARFCFFRNPWFVSQKELGDPKELAEAVSLMLRRFYVQTGAVLLGIFVLFLLTLLVKKTRFLESLTICCFIVTPLLLVATKVLGRGMEENGADLWINIGPISLQLTEFAKISYAVVLASFFKNRPRLRTQIFFALWAALVFFLIMLLPDLGSAMILLPATVIVFVTMTSEYFKGLLIILASSAAGTLAYAFFPHVQARIAGWTSLWVEVNARNAQIIYGLQGVARGGLLGRGLTNGNPWGIPLFNSDMVFAIVVEEFGLLVGLAIVVFYTVIWLRSGRGAALARDGFSAGLILALGTILFVEAVVVIGGTTGLLPLTGATLPFIARGGSSIFAKYLIMGILLGLLARQEAGANRSR